MRWGQLVFSQLQEEKNNAVFDEDYDEAKRLKVIQFFLAFELHLTTT